MELEFGLLTICDDDTTESKSLLSTKTKEEPEFSPNCLYNLINNFINLKNIELKYMSNGLVIKYSMEKNEDSINANINFLLMNPLMFKIISQLSFKNAFKQKPDTTVNYNLSFLCLWLKNKDNFLYFDNTVDRKIKSESKNAAY
jgi:hypothetical protein